MTNLSNLIEVLAKQALGNQTTNNQQQNTNTGFGGVLGSVLGQVLNQQTNQNSNNQTGLGGILGSVLNQFGQSSGTASGGKSAVLLAVVPLILNWIQQQGGLQAALDKLKQAGFSSQVQSWVSPEHNVENEQVNSNQLEMLFDDAQVEQVASQTNTEKNTVYSAIAGVLPQVIDALTPKGEQSNSQEANQDIQNVLNLVSGFLRK